MDIEWWFESQSRMYQIFSMHSRCKCGCKTCFQNRWTPCTDPDIQDNDNQVPGYSLPSTISCREQWIVISSLSYVQNILLSLRRMSTWLNQHSIIAAPERKREAASSYHSNLVTSDVGTIGFLYLQKNRKNFSQLRPSRYQAPMNMFHRLIVDFP